MYILEKFDNWIQKKVYNKKHCVLGVEIIGCCDTVKNRPNGQASANDQLIYLDVMLLGVLLCTSEPYGKVKAEPHSEDVTSKGFVIYY